MSPATLKAIRLTHLYSGVFLAPAILFFAITGGLQMFSLHETTRGSSYKPPALLVSLGQIHKKGTYVLPPRRQPPPANSPATGTPAPGTPAPGTSPGAPAKPAPQAEPQRPASPNPLPFKIFAAITSIGLVLSTLSGLVMSWMYSRRKLLIVGLFVAGVILPPLLLMV